MGCGSSVAKDAVPLKKTGAAAYRVKNPTSSSSTVSGAGSSTSFSSSDHDANFPHSDKRLKAKNANSSNEDAHNAATSATLDALLESLPKNIHTEYLETDWFRTALESNQKREEEYANLSVSEKATEFINSGVAQNAVLTSAAILISNSPFPAAQLVGQILQKFAQAYEKARTKKQWMTEFMQYLSRVEKELIESLKAFGDEGADDPASIKKKRKKNEELINANKPVVHQFLQPITETLKSTQELFATIAGRHGLESFFMAVKDEESLNDARSKIEKLKSESLSSMLTGIKTETKEIMNFLKAAAREEEDRRIKRDLLRQFAPLDYQDDLQTELQRYMPGTCVDFIKQISEWIEKRRPKLFTNDLPSEDRLMWFHGSAGSGKSTIAAVIWERYYRTNLVVHVCNHSLSNRRDPNRILKSITFQLMDLMPQYRDFIITKLSNKAPLDSFSTPDLFTEFLAKPFATEASWKWWTHPHKCVILLDAFDESEGDGDNALLKLLKYDRTAGQNALAKLPNWLCFIITSRTDPGHNEIKTAFPDATTHAGHGYKHVQLQRSKDDSDLKTFLQFALSLKHPARIDIKPKERKQAVDALAAKCGGLFLQAQLILKRYGCDTDHMGPLARVAMVKLAAKESAKESMTQGKSPTPGKSQTPAPLKAVNVDPLLLKALIASQAELEKVREDNEKTHKKKDDPEKACLDMAAIESLSEGLGAFYEDSIKRICETYERANDLSRLLQLPKDRLLPLAMSAIELVAVAQEPMSINILTEALHLQRSYHFFHLFAPFTVLFPINCQVDVNGMVDHAASRIGVFHKSVLDWFSHASRLERGITAAVHIDISIAHGRLADLCWAATVKGKTHQNQSSKPDRYDNGAGESSGVLLNEANRNTWPDTVIPPILDVDSLLHDTGNSTSSLLRYAISFGPTHAIVCRDVRLAACFLCHPQFLHMRSITKQTASLGVDYTRAIHSWEPKLPFRVKRSLGSSRLWLSMAEAKSGLIAFQRFYRQDVRIWSEDSEMVYQCALVSPPSSPVAQAAAYINSIWFLKWAGRQRQLVEWQNRPTEFSSLVDLLRGPPPVITHLICMKVPADWYTWLHIRSPQDDISFWYAGSQGQIVNKHSGTIEVDGLVAVTVTTDGTVYQGDAFGNIRAWKHRSYGPTVITNISSRIRDGREENAQIIAMTNATVGMTHFIFCALAISDTKDIKDSSKTVHEIHVWSKTANPFLPSDETKRYDRKVRADMAPMAKHLGKFDLAIQSKITVMEMADGVKQLFIGMADGTLRCLSFDIVGYHYDMLGKVPTNDTEIKSVISPLLRKDYYTSATSTQSGGTPGRSTPGRSRDARGRPLSSVNAISLNQMMPRLGTPSFLPDELDTASENLNPLIPYDPIEVVPLTTASPAAQDKPITCIAVRPRAKPVETPPSQLFDPYHANHQLSKVNDLGSYVCGWCDGKGQGEGYKCSEAECNEKVGECKFIGHVYCARPDLFIVESGEDFLKHKLDDRHIDPGNTEIAIACGSDIFMYIFAKNSWNYMKMFRSDSTILSLAYSFDTSNGTSSRLASGEAGQWVKVYDTIYNVIKCQWSFRASARVPCVSWGQSDILYYASGANVSQVSVKSGIPVRIPRREDDSLGTTCAFAPKSAHNSDRSNDREHEVPIVIGSYTGLIKVLNGESTQVKYEVKPSAHTCTGRINHIRFHHDDKRIGTVGWDRCLRLWQLESESCSFKSEPLDSELVWLDFHPTLPHTVCATKTGTMYLFVGETKPTAVKTWYYLCRKSIGGFSLNGQLLFVNGMRFIPKPQLSIQNPGVNKAVRQFRFTPDISVPLICDFCKMLSSGPGYTFTDTVASESSLIYLHPTCAEYCSSYNFASKVNLPSRHSEHDLTHSAGSQMTKAEANEKSQCDLCGQGLEDGYYSCQQCHNTKPVCVACVRFLQQYPNEVSVSSCEHKPKLRIWRTSWGNHSCQVCRSPMSDTKFFYICNLCGFFCHLTCTTTDAKLNVLEVPEMAKLESEWQSHKLNVGGASLDCMAQSPDKKWLCLGGGSTLVVKDCSSNDLVEKHRFDLQKMNGNHSQRVLTCAFSERKQFSIKSFASQNMAEQEVTLLSVAMATPYDISISIFMAGSWQLVQKFAGHTQEITSLSFHPIEIHRLISSGYDNCTRIWEISTDLIEQAAMAVSSKAVQHPDGFEFQRKVNRNQTSSQLSRSLANSTSVHTKGVSSVHVAENANQFALISVGPNDLYQWYEPKALSTTNAATGNLNTLAAHVNHAMTASKPSQTVSRNLASRQMNLQGESITITDCLIDLVSKKFYVASREGISRFSLASSDREVLWKAPASSEGSSSTGMEHAKLLFLPPVAIQGNRAGKTFEESIRELEADDAEPNPSKVSFIHTGYTCNTCCAPSIVGLRYTCIQCSGYHLCENCKRKTHHDIDKGHQWEEWPSIEERKTVENKNQDTEEDAKANDSNNNTKIEGATGGLGGSSAEEPPKSAPDGTAQKPGKPIPYVEPGIRAPGSLKIEQIQCEKTLLPLFWTLKSHSNLKKVCSAIRLIYKFWKGDTDSNNTLLPMLAYVTCVENELASMKLDPRRTYEPLSGLCKHLGEIFQLFQTTIANGNAAVLRAQRDAAKVSAIKGNISKLIYQIYCDLVWQKDSELMNQQVVKSSSSEPTSSPSIDIHPRDALNTWTTSQMQNSVSSTKQSQWMEQIQSAQMYDNFLALRSEAHDSYFKGSRDTVIADIQKWIDNSMAIVQAKLKKASAPSAGASLGGLGVGGGGGGGLGGVIAPVPASRPTTSSGAASTKSSEKLSKNGEDEDEDEDIDAALPMRERVTFIRSGSREGKTVLATAISERLKKHCIVLTALNYNRDVDDAMGCVLRQLAAYIPAYNAWASDKLRTSEFRLWEGLKYVVEECIVAPFTDPKNIELYKVFEDGSSSLVIVVKYSMFFGDSYFTQTNQALKQLVPWIRFVVLATLPPEQEVKLVSDWKNFNHMIITAPQFASRYILCGSNPDHSDVMKKSEQSKFLKVYDMETERSEDIKGSSAVERDLKSIASIGVEGAGVKAMDIVSYTRNNRKMNLLVTSSAQYIHLIDLNTQKLYYGHIAVDEAAEAAAAAAKAPTASSSATPAKATAPTAEREPLHSQFLAHLREKSDTATMISSNDVKFLMLNSNGIAEAT